MHKMLAIVTDVRGVSLSVTWLKSVAARAVYAACMCVGSFGAAFAKCLWPLVLLHVVIVLKWNRIGSD